MRKHRTCQYPVTSGTDEDDLIKLIGRFQVNDRLGEKLDSSFRARPIDFSRIRRSKRFGDCGEVYLSELLTKLIRGKQLCVTDGHYYLPLPLISQT